MTHRARISTFGYPLLIALGASLFMGCTAPASEPEPEPDNGIKSGIWLLAGSAHPLGSGDDPCRPMMMQTRVSSTEVTLERRLFPCYSNTYSFDHISFEREGSILRIGNQIMGEINDRKLDVNLPFASGTISWDMDREYEPYRENSSKGLFIAYPALRPDSTPVATHVVLQGKEGVPLIGRLHAARLPDTTVHYDLENTLAHSKLEYFDPDFGFFRVQPDLDFAGFDGFPFWPIYDGVELPREKVEIFISGKPEIPQSTAMTVEAFEEFPAYITPEIINPDSLEYTLEIVDPPQHGAIKVEGSTPSSWDFVYTSDPDYVGPDSFTYAAVVPQGVSAKALVEITVQPVDDPPIAGDLNLEVTANDATPFHLPITDIDSSFLTCQFIQTPNFGQVYGDSPDLLYVPDVGVSQANDSFTYVAFDFTSQSAPGLVNIAITPGPYPSRVLTGSISAGAVPAWQDPWTVYYRASFSGVSPAIGMAGFGFTSQVLQEREFDTFGFDNTNGNARRTVFFDLGSNVHFTTTTLMAGVRFYRAIGLSSERRFDIPAPNPNVVSEPSVGDAYVEGENAYLPIHWQTLDSQYICQVWKIGAMALQPELVHDFAPTKTPCFSLSSLGSAQYMFAGSNLVQFPTMASPPVVIKDLGNAEPLPWLVEAGGKLFFQTRTSIQGNTRVDLWVTDGTEAGTQIVKEIETAFFHFDIFSPLAYSDKLYFAHKKSLWSSDGTAAGTNIVMTLPVTNVGGDGAIGSISVLGGRMYFLATTDTSGREPWISTGTAAGTKLLKDIEPGPLGSSVASTNSKYFHEWNGSVLFLAKGNAESTGLWTTDGTSIGTKLLKKRSMTTILGIIASGLVYHDEQYIFSMSL